MDLSQLDHHRTFFSVSPTDHTGTPTDPVVGNRIFRSCFSTEHPLLGLALFRHDGILRGLSLLAERGLITSIFFCVVVCGDLHSEQGCQRTGAVIAVHCRACRRQGVPNGPTWAQED